MGNPLRDRRPVAELAAKRQVIEIADKIGAFSRLAGIIEADLAALDPDKLPRGWRDSAVTGRLAFGFADAQQQLAMLEGEVAATVDAVCQRCLEPFRLPLASRLQVLPVVIGNEAPAGSGFDVWELEDEMVCPADIVEEALIMAMPLSAMHTVADDCSTIAATTSGTAQTTKPFAALKAQLDENR